MDAIPALLLLLAQAPASEAAPAAAAEAADRRECSSEPPSEEEDEIIVCVERPQGYRIDPDILEAKRRLKQQKKKRPERLTDTSCKSVGPFGCPTMGVNLLGAALTAAEMARRAAEGENVGEMFVTDPQPDEYRLYLAAKRAREAREEAEKKARAARPEPLADSEAVEAVTSAETPQP